MLSQIRKLLNHPNHYIILILPLFLFALTFPVTIGLTLAQATKQQPTTQTLGVMTSETTRKPPVLECSACGGGSLCLDKNRRRALCVPPSYASEAAKMSNVTCISCLNPTLSPSVKPTTKNCRYVEVQCTTAPCPRQYICSQ